MDTQRSSQWIINQATTFHSELFTFANPEYEISIKHKRDKNESKHWIGTADADCRDNTEDIPQFINYPEMSSDYYLLMTENSVARSHNYSIIWKDNTENKEMNHIVVKSKLSHYVKRCPSEKFNMIYTQ